MNSQDLSGLILSDVTKALADDDFQAALGEVVTTAFSVASEDIGVSTDGEMFLASMQPAIEATEPD